tara:strand:- start:39 stop:149 length:111 start_codon:yes stop_codon:yes gene_type:complete
MSQKSYPATNYEGKDNVYFYGENDEGKNYNLMCIYP